MWVGGGVVEWYAGNHIVILSHCTTVTHQFVRVSDIMFPTAGAEQTLAQQFLLQTEKKILSRKSKTAPGQTEGFWFDN